MALIAAFLQAASFTLDKVILSFKRVDFRLYIGISFPIIFLINVIIFYIFKPPLLQELLFGDLFIWLLASVALTIISNVIYYRALERDKLSEIEVIGLLTALPVILFSSAVFADERNTGVIILAILASVAIIWSHLDNGRILVKKETLPFLIWCLTLAPLSAAISKVLLQQWNPISLEMVRAGLVAVAITPFFRNNFSKVPLRALSYLLLTNLLTSIAWILFYFSYQTNGIIYTMLLFSIQPLLVYLAAIFILKEKIDKKKLIAFLIVLICIGIAQFLSQD